MIDESAIGIHFDFPREYDWHLVPLFEHVQIERYTWYVACSENYCSCNGHIKQFLPDGVYSGKAFKRLIYSTGEYYIHLIRLIAVPAGMPFEQERIHTYEDYVNSNAQIVLLSADSIVDFYAKELNVLKPVMEFCEQNYSVSGKQPYFLTIANDTRTGFWI